MPALIFENALHFDDREKCEILANIFSKSFTLPQNTELPTFEPLTRYSLENIYFTVSDVSKLLKALPARNSNTPDLIPAILLKNCHQSLAPIVTEFFRTSIDSGEIPDLWKKSFVIPVPKKGNSSDPNNYRPISLTCILSRTLERIIAEQIFEFLFMHNLISPSQFGFIRNRSTTTQLLVCLEKWFQSLNAGDCFDCIYIDFLKAFDSVYIPALTKKLFAIGIRGKLLKWIESFLTNRTFQVKINDSFSEEKPVLSGVPQGSVLGPLLFLIFINDLPSFCAAPNVDPFLFADDAKLSSTFSAKKEPLENHLPLSLEKACQWSSQWKIKINPTKSRILHGGKNNPKRKYSINDNEIPEVETIRDLGVEVDTKLQFKVHISKIIKNAYFRAHQILRVLKTNDLATWRLAYISYVRPLLEYASETWNPSLIGEKTRIEKVQKFCTRRILKKCHLPYCQYPKRLKILDLQSLESRRLISDLIMVYKIIHHKVPLDPKSFFNLPARPSLRRHEFQIKPKYIGTKKQNSFSTRIINFWNDLDQETVNAKNLSVYKGKLIGNLKNLQAKNRLSNLIFPL